MMVQMMAVTMVD
jgi:hypothetical protein